MGDLTLAQFQTEFLAGLGNRSTNIYPADRVTIALNLAQRRIARSYDFSEMAQVSFAQMNFTQQPALDKYLVPPPLTKSIHSFVLLDTSSGVSSLGQSKKVIERPWRLFDKKYPSPEWLPTGWPTEYARWGNIIVMAPAPFLQFTAQLRWTSYPSAFVVNNADQTSDFDNKDDVIVCYALAYAFKLLGRADRAAYFEGLAKEQLDEAIEKDDNRPDMEVSGEDAGPADNGAYWQQPFIKSAG